MEPAILTKTYYFEYFSSHGRIIIYSKPYKEEEDDLDKSDGEATIDALKIVFEDIKPNNIYICELHDECDPYVDTFKFYEDGDEDCDCDDEDCCYYGNIIYKTTKKSEDRYSFYQKVFKQVNKCFITEYPYDEETMMRQEEKVDKLKGLPKKVLNHIDDNLDCRYFMIAFDLEGNVAFNQVIYPE